MSLVDLIGFATGVTALVFIAKQKRINFAFGIVSMACYSYTMWISSLYANWGLGLIFIALQIYGWITWGRDQAPEAEVHRTTRTVAVRLIVGAAAMTLLLYGLLQATGNSSAPALDALTTSLSLTAQFMVARKLFENWFLWAVADVIYIYLFVTQGLWVWAALYAVYLSMAAYGVISWRRSLTQAPIAEKPQRTART